MAEPRQVQHQPEATRFIIETEHEIAHLDYTLTSGIMDIHHTYVPPALRGQNIAGLLADAAFNFANEQQLRIIPSCSYIARYAQRKSKAN